MQELVLFVVGCFIYIWLLFLTGCASVTNGPYNQDTIQDGQCYSKYMGMKGYCDRSPKDIN